MNPVEAWKAVVLERYAKFDGRAARPEFWWFYVANIIAAIVLVILTQISSIFWVLYAVYFLAIIIPSIAVAIRRLHDSDKSGWWLLITFIPFGSIVLIVFWCLAGTPGPNKFGAGPELSDRPSGVA